MLNLILSIIALGSLVATFVDNALLRDAQKKQLQKKFEKWWRQVEHYDRLKLALVFVAKANDLLDFTFGKPLLSGKMVFRCIIVSAMVFTMCICWLGYINGEQFGFTPWTIYNKSIAYTLQTTQELSSITNLETYSEYDLVSPKQRTNASVSSVFVNINSNLFLLTMSTNGFHRIDKVFNWGHGHLNVMYVRAFKMGETNMSTNIVGQVTAYADPYKMICDDMNTLSHRVASYDKPIYAFVYSVGYFCVLYAGNAFLFMVSLGFCRVTLREMELSGRILSMASLVFTNVVTVLSLSCVLLLIMVVVSMPIAWLFIPSMFTVSEESFYTAAVYTFGGSFMLYLMSGGATKLVLMIAFLPNMLAALIGVFTLLAVVWRNAFHFIVKSVLIRCAEKSPIVFLITVISFVSGMLVELAHLIHPLSFL